jgi:surfeit locus 1 family protein
VVSLRFRPPLWACLLALAAATLFSSLSYWQVQRGQEKADIIARRAPSNQSELIDVNASGRFPSYGRRVQMSGNWEPERPVLLDNQTHQHAIGVHVWTPLRLVGSDHLVLVNRGWLASSVYREALPDTGALPAGRVTISGLWRDLPRAGIRADDGICDAQANWPQRLNYPSFDLLACLYQQPLSDGLVLLDAPLPDGFVREWADLGIPPQRHYGYALQWAAFALTALVLFVVINWKRQAK